MSKRKKNAGHGYGMDFHGAFSSKEDAKKKERKVHGFIRPTTIKGERRYVVMSERKNPRPRRKRTNPVLFDPALNAYSAWERTKKWGTVYGHGSTQREAVRDLKQRLDDYKAGEKPGAMKGYGGSNPMDLMVMGANPSPGEKRDRQRKKLKAAEDKFYALAEKARLARKHGDPNYESINDESARAFEELELQRRIYAPMTGNPHEITVHPGETITLKVNPSAEAIREEFTGREYEYTFISDEPHMRAGDYAQIGDMVGISFKPKNGGQVKAIGWYEGSDRIPLHEAAKSLRTLTDAPVLVSDTTRRQLYFVSGNQDLSALILAYIDDGHDSKDGDIWELGDARTVVYREKKWMDDFRTINYQHRFGEENGRVPKLLYDARLKRLLLEGGDYEVRPEGITN